MTTAPRRIAFDRAWPLHGLAATRAIETTAAAALPPHTLMQRAGLSVARLALAIAPHARTVWIACGPGNNGGDGLEAAAHLQAWGRSVTVTWLGDETRAPPDSHASLNRARDAGVVFADPPAQWDFAIDALLGIGTARPLEGRMAGLVALLNASPSPVLSVDVPSGLDAATGHGDSVRASHTLSLLTLKPGLFTAGGRDAAGDTWFDDLGVPATNPPQALLVAPPASARRAHASHKGSYGDVAVVGGAPGMVGAALLAATAALSSGAGRVFVGLLERGTTVDAMQPELMFRDPATLDFSSMAVACGCGGGDAVRALLPRVLSTSRHLVLDADALNAAAADSQLQSQLRARAGWSRATVLTPHPLEAARLLGCSTQAVQADRLDAASKLAANFDCTIVLKGSGTVIATPGEVNLVNPTGNARLATAGTGDVLAGMIVARLAAGLAAHEAAASAVYLHGRTADDWPVDEPLGAATLARRLRFAG